MMRFIVIHREVSRDWNKKKKIRLDIRELVDGEILPDNFDPKGTDLHVMNIDVDHPFANLHRGAIVEIGICVG
jgi:hypothetical protein